MSSTAYDKYLQQAGGLAGGISQAEGNLYTQWQDKYENEADRENTKKQIDVGKAAFDIAQGESMVGQAVALGTAGMVAIQGGKKIYGSVKETYAKHYGDPEGGEEEQVAEGDEGEALDRVGQGGGVRDGDGDGEHHYGAEGEGEGRAASAADDEDVVGAGAGESSVAMEEGHGTVGSGEAGLDTLEGVQVGGRGGEVAMTIDYAKADRAGSSAIHEGEVEGVGYDGRGGELRDMAGEKLEQEYPTTSEAGMGEGGLEHESLLRQGAETSEAFQGAGEVAEEAGASASLGLGEALESGIAGLAERSFVADVALQAVPFLGEAVDLAAVAYGAYQGISLYEKGSEEQTAAAGDPVNPPAAFGRTAPSLNNSIAIPVFDTTRQHNSGHISTF
jgi:hypothetical protein